MKESKIAVVLMNNEIILDSLKKALEKMGYEVRQDLNFCLDARFAIVGAYFAYLGVVKQLKSINPALPVVAIECGDYKLNGSSASIGELCDVICIENKDEAEIRQKISGWFARGQGKVLTQ